MTNGAEEVPKQQLSSAALQMLLEAAQTQIALAASAVFGGGDPTKPSDYGLLLETDLEKAAIAKELVDAGLARCVKNTGVESRDYPQVVIATPAGAVWASFILVSRCEGFERASAVAALSELSTTMVRSAAAEVQRKERERRKL